MKFETDGITYNLGVIDNKQTGSNNPSNETDVEVEINNRGKTLLYLLMAILLILLLAPILPYIVQLVILIISIQIRLVIGIVRSIGKQITKRRRE